MRITAILCVRNEGAFLLDWLAHHLAVGVTHVVALSNACDDGTDALLDRLAQIAPVTHIRNEGPYNKAGVQFTALRRAVTEPAVQEADWLLPLDIDEFVNVHAGAHTLPDLIAALPEATAITLTWRLFGNAQIARYSDTPVTRQFQRAAPAVMHWPWRASMFKTLVRNDGTYQSLGVHRPRDPVPDRLEAARWYDGEGRALPPRFATQGVFSPFGRANTRLVQLNHYALQSMESYVLKAARGRAVHSDDVLGLDYWTERNFNTEDDRSILALEEPVATERARLAADPELTELHAQSVAWRHQRFAQLMGEDTYRALFGRLLMTPPSHPLTPAQAGFLLRHATHNRAEPR